MTIPDELSRLLGVRYERYDRTAEWERASANAVHRAYSAHRSDQHILDAASADNRAARRAHDEALRQLSDTLEACGLNPDRIDSGRALAAMP